MSIQQKIKKAITSFRKLPAHKSHIDLLAAILTIPMLLTVITLNLLNLQSKSQPQKNSPSPTPVIIQVDQKSTAPQVNTAAFQTSPIPTSATCKKGIGPIAISYPQEGQTVSSNPVCISIDYNGDGYCSVAWAYKVNTGDWSDYTNTSVCLYNLPQGSNTFTLDVKSTVGSSSQTILRHFTYAPTGTVSPTPINSPMPSITSTQ